MRTGYMLIKKTKADDDYVSIFFFFLTFNFDQSASILIVIYRGWHFTPIEIRKINSLYKLIDKQPKTVYSIESKSVSMSSILCQEAAIQIRSGLRACVVELDTFFLIDYHSRFSAYMVSRSYGRCDYLVPWD